MTAREFIDLVYAIGAWTSLLAVMALLVWVVMALSPRDDED